MTGITDPSLDPPSKTHRAVLDALKENGPLSHKTLARQANLEWNELTEIIRSLRMNNQVEIRIDRRYELT